MRLIAKILLMFILAQLLGFFTGIVVLNDFYKNPYITDLIISGDSSETSNALFFTLYVVLGGAFMVALIRLFKLHPIVFFLLEFVLVSTSSSIVFYSIFRAFSGYAESMIAGIIIGLLFSGSRFFSHKMKNQAAILATAGVGVIFGVSLGLIPVLLFLFFLSIYDFLSVFATKHMVELANYVVKKDLAFTITAKISKDTEDGKAESRIDLGTGDMIAPIMLEVSLLSFNPIASIFVFVGAVISMGIFLYMVRKKRIILPALPPIVIGMVIALAIGLILNFY